MTWSDNVTTYFQHTAVDLRPRHLLALFVIAIAGMAVIAQDARETAIVPFPELLQRPVELRPELKGVHPRVFFTADEIVRLRTRSKGVDRDLWLKAVGDMRALRREPPDPKDPELYKSGLEQKTGSISQYGMAFAIAEATFAYAIEQDPKYLDSAKKWTLAACEMPMWGYTYDKPNVDLPPAHLLYAVAFTYDVLFDKLSADEKQILRNKLTKQGQLMYDYFKYKLKKRYTYSQNHTWIPMAGLAIAAYAVMDEVPAAKDWARLSRAIFDRVITTFATDGYYYEGFHYFGFAFRWVIRYFDAHLAATGENLYLPMREKLASMKYYAMHSILPDGENAFDFADIGDGALNRNGTSKRESLYAEYDMIYRLAAVFNDSQAQAVGDFIRNNTKLATREPMWAFINHKPDLKSAPLSEIPLQFYFRDNDTVFWRSDWTKNATAIAFRCAPPEGHHAAELAAKIPDWRQNDGHAHPDANSFIIWANGKYLTGDTGYLGIKQTDDHNTILINGRGQEKDGVYEMFAGVPNERLDKIRIADVAYSADYLYVRGDAASAYYADLGVKKFDRNFLFVAPDHFVIWDELETEKPAMFTFMLNADRDIRSDGPSAELINGSANLIVQRVLPFNARSEVVPQTVQARGLPGSVDKGDSEQRGVQLRTTSLNEANKFEFVHFLRTRQTADKTAMPKVSAFPETKSLLIKWPSGDSEYVYLTGKGPDLKSDTRPVIVRKNSAGNVKKLISSR